MVQDMRLSPWLPAGTRGKINSSEPFCSASHHFYIIVDVDSGPTGTGAEKCSLGSSAVDILSAPIPHFSKP